MQRYLVSFSYIGTRFRGAQVQLPPGPRHLDYDDRTTIQGIFNIAFRRFKPSNTPVFVLSSRTDAGVHALGSSGHVDLAHPRQDQGHVFQPEFLARGLNRYFDKAAVDISVHGLQCVPETFHARHSAAGRVYLYRLAVVREAAWPAGGDRTTAAALTPVTELRRSWVIGRPFNMERLLECADLLSGEHDFRSFMGAKKGADPDLDCHRHLEIKVSPGITPVETPDLEFWDLTFSSTGFLYRQVRRTVGVLVATAQGRLSLDDVRRLLDVPSKESWNPRAVTAPPHGLYLRQVTYAPDSLAGAASAGTLEELGGGGERIRAAGGGDGRSGTGGESGGGELSAVGGGESRDARAELVSILERIAAGRKSGCGG